MTESLLHLCGRKMASWLAEGKITKCEPKLSVDLSNIIFHYFINDEQPTKENIDYITATLQVTHVSIHQTEMDDYRAMAVFNQNLESLELLSLKSWTMFHAHWGEGDQMLEGVAVDINYALQTLISPTSRKLLKHLAIDGNGIRFTSHWPESISSFYQSLRSLSLDNCATRQYDFDLITWRFNELTKLKICHANIKNINGIYKVPDLEVLNISESEVEEMEDFFECKKLRCLVIAGKPEDNPSKVFTYYMNCGKSLPELRMMDCSYNEITEEQLQTLIKTHPKLELVSLIGTPLERRHQYDQDGRKVKLLTTANFSNCLDSIQHLYTHCHKSTSQQHHMDSVIIKLVEYLDTDYQNQTDEDLRRCLDLMCDIYRNSRTKRDAIQLLCLQCLFAVICESSTRPNLFSFAQQQTLIKTVFHRPFPNRIIESRTNRDFVKRCQVSMILNNDSLLQGATRENLEQISEFAVGTVMASLTITSKAVRHCVIILLKIFKYSPSVKLHDLCIDRHIMCNLLQFIQADRKENDTSDYIYSLIVEILQKRCLNPSHPNHLMNDFMTMTILTVVFSKAGNQNDSWKTLNQIIILLPHMHEGIVEFFTTPDNFRIFLKHITRGYIGEDNLILVLYIRVFFIQQLKTTEDDLFVSTKRIRNEMKSILEKYRPTEDSRLLDLFRFIHEETPNEETKIICSWIIKQFAILETEEIEMENERKRIKLEVDERERQVEAEARAE